LLLLVVVVLTLAAAALADIARQRGHLVAEHLLKAYCL